MAILLQRFRFPSAPVRLLFSLGSYESQCFPDCEPGDDATSSGWPVFAEKQTSVAKDLPKRLVTCLGSERQPDGDGLYPGPPKWEGPGLGDLMLAGKA